MITRLTNRKLEVAEKIRAVFQMSYQVEASLLNASYFPPLHRPLEDYVNSTTQFFGYWKNHQLAGVIEIIDTKSYTHIRSLVVDPFFFRQGVAKALMEYTLNTFDANLFIVETGLENGPASSLYKKFGFVEVEQWDTEHGIRKIKFQKKIRN